MPTTCIAEEGHITHARAGMLQIQKLRLLRPRKRIERSARGQRAQSHNIVVALLLTSEELARSTTKNHTNVRCQFHVRYAEYALYIRGDIFTLACENATASAQRHCPLSPLPSPGRLLPSAPPCTSPSDLRPRALPRPGQCHKYVSPRCQLFPARSFSTPH